jgi:hypothetical protein
MISYNNKAMNKINNITNMINIIKMIKSKFKIILKIIK